MKIPFIENKYYLGPGHVVISDKPALIWIVLGSCVSIILYDEKSRLTAACHAQLPSKTKKNTLHSEVCPQVCYNEQPDRNEMKYLDTALDYMIHRLAKKGVLPAQLCAFILGGSNIMQKERTNSIGELNVKKAHELLKKYGIPLRSEQSGGNKGRTIIFDTLSGEYSIKLQRSSLENELTQHVKKLLHHRDTLK